MNLDEFPDLRGLEVLEKAHTIYQVKLPAGWLVKDVCSDSHDALTVNTPVTLLR